MSSCNKNASESNNKTSTTISVLNEEYNNDDQEAAVEKTFENNETLDETKNIEEQQQHHHHQNIVNIDDVANIETVRNQNENAKIIMNTPATPAAAAATIATTTNSIMLPQPTDIVVTAIEKETTAVTATTDANIMKINTAVADVENLKESTTTLATATAPIAPIINATPAATKSVAFNLFQHQGQSTNENIAAVAATTLSLTTTTSATTTITTPPTTPTHEAAATGPHLPHIASEPTFSILLRRNQQQQQQQQKNFKIHHDTNQPEILATALLSSPSPSPLLRDNIATTSSGIRSGSVSASASPSMVRKCSESMFLPRRVSFPKSDNELVTGYLEPANPWEHAFMVKSISEIAELYVMSCQKHKTKPLQTILDHLKIVELNKTIRQPLLSLKSIKMAPSDCEALEEVFKRVQYKAIDLSSCELNETAASALFEMIEYYEAANELDISSNAEGMTHRGWTSCTYMISHSRALQVLNAQGNPISKAGAENLGHAISTSNLHTIKLEHCGLKGAPLSSLCFKLRNNRILKELWLAHNDLDCDDAETIAKLLTDNHYLQLVDISNNNIRDLGLKRIVRALIAQTRELEKRSLLQRTAAIDDDDCGSLSPVEVATHLDFSTKDTAISSCGTNGNHNENIASNNTNSTSGLLDSDASHSEDTDDEAFETAKKTATNDDNLLVFLEVKASAATVGGGLLIANSTEAAGEATIAHTTTTAALTTVPTATSMLITASTDDLDADEDTEETVKSSNQIPRNNAALQSSNGGGGQSMLDKLLSMNSTDSSSDEAASNLSTDTIAACCSEDASLISDDIFDGTLATTIATATTNTSTNSNVTTMRSPHSPTQILEIKCSPATAFLTEAATQSQQKMLHGNGTVSSGDRAADAANGGSGAGDNSNTESSNGSSCSSGICSSNINNNSHNNNNNENSHHHHHHHHHQLQHSVAVDDDSSLQTSGIFEVTAEENDCLISTASSNDDERLSEHHATLLLQHSTKALDVNKNTKLIDDFDDTHSTDSAFESASEGDISRNLPEEFGRLSTSFESTRIDESATTKDLGSIETATIATESTECLVAAAATPASTPTPPPIVQLPPLPPKIAPQMCSEDSSPTPTLTAAVIVAAVAMKTSTTHEGVAANSSVETEHDTTTFSLSSLPPLPPPPHPPAKVTIAEDSLLLSKSKMCITTPSPTPPPPSNSPGGVSVGMRRTESSCTFITPSTRHRSQSSDSLCSDNSLDGSISSDISFSTSTQINEKLAKNDTLTRQQKQLEAPVESNNKAPCGLKALALWNNNLTKESGAYVAELLTETGSLELLNIGKNCLSNDFVSVIKDSLVRNTTLTTLGMQSAHLSAKGIETLSSILSFGGNSTLQRIDIRDNKLEVESLSTLAESLKSNTTVTQIDIDDEPKRLSVGNDAHLDYARVLENVRSMCSRNEKTQSQLQAADKSSALANMGRRRGGYYLGSRKISLTCHSRPVVVDNAGGGSSTAVSTSSSNSKLDVKRKPPGTRLRSPVPSPPTVSPSSSPSRSRFKVFRVNEVSPLTSPMATTPSPSPPPPPTTAVAPSSCSVAIPTTNATISSSCSNSSNKMQSTSLPTASSLKSMASITSSTQSIKRHSMSPRSRFQVSKIYEDPHVPIANRSLPPITPPLNAPPTPMSKTSTSSLSTFVPTPTAVVLKTEVAEATDLSHTPNVDSTKQMTATSAQIRNKTTLSPISSASASSSPSSSSSSSTSPASISSISSSSSTSSSRALFESSYDTDDLTNQPAHVVPTSGARCPIAVFDENDITLTKNSVNNVLSSNSTAPSPTPTPIQIPVAAESKEDTDSTLTAAVNVTAITPHHQQQQHQEQQQPLQPRVRKTSWYGNPAAVDKLLTLFQNPGTIFQRSSSPEPSLVVGAAVTTSPSTAAQAHCTAAFSQTQNSLVSTRKCSPPSWSKLGNEMMRPVTNALQQTAAVSGVGDTTNTASTLVTAANSVVALEQSISFLDATTKQICDFSKQVFRQNLSFGNETNAAALTSNTAAGIVTPSMLTTNNGSGVIVGSEQHDAAYIPSDVKLEIKENISPEHTINDETLKSLQKLCPATAATAVPPPSASAAAAVTATAVEMPMTGVLDTDEIKEQLCSSLTPTASTTSTSLQHEEQLTTTTQTSS